MDTNVLVFFRNNNAGKKQRGDPFKARFISGLCGCVSGNNSINATLLAWQRNGQADIFCHQILHEKEYQQRNVSICLRFFFISITTIPQYNTNPSEYPSTAQVITLNYVLEGGITSCDFYQPSWYVKSFLYLSIFNIYLYASFTFYRTFKIDNYQGCFITFTILGTVHDKSGTYW